METRDERAARVLQSVDSWGRSLGMQALDGPGFIDTFDMAIRVALRHPEWAAGFRQLTDEIQTPVPDGMPPVEAFIDQLVNYVPIQALSEEEMKEQEAKIEAIRDALTQPF